MDYHILEMNARNRDYAYREIGFDSKPISKIECAEGTQLQVGVGSRNACEEWVRYEDLEGGLTS